MANALIASLGFDERHVIRNLLRIGFKGIKKIILLIPSWDIDSRTKRAIDEIVKIAVIAGLERNSIVTYRVDVKNLYNAVKAIYRLFRELVNEEVDKVIVSLGGGLRALIIEAFLAIILLDRNTREKITVIVDLETGEDYIVVDPSMPFNYIPSENEVLVLNKLFQMPMSFKELLETTKLPRTTLWKTLCRLQENKLVKQQESKYAITEIGKIISLKQYS